MSSTQPIVLSQALPVIPDLGVAAAYEEWRTTSLKIEGVSRKVLADYLIATNSEIGLLRATLILGVEAEHFDTAYQLAGQLLCAEDKVIQLYGRYQAAFLTIRGGFSSDIQAPITAQTAIPTLKDILMQVEALSKRNALALELEMRIYFVLCEAYLVIEDFEIAHLYASKMAMLSPIVGLETMIYSARSLVAMCLHCLGQSKSALTMMQQLRQDPKNYAYRFYTALDLAQALYFEGDFSNALQLVSDQVGASTELQAHLQAYQLLTLLRPQVEIQTKHLTNRIQALTMAYQHLYTAFSLNLHSEDRQIVFREARLASSDFSHNSNTWRAGFEKLLNAFCSLRARDYGLVLPNLPSIHQLENYPLWVRILGLALKLEAILRMNSAQVSHAEFFDLGLELRNILNDVDVHVLRQITDALQLYTPYALACLSVLGQVKEVVVAAGQNTILNLNTRPISVYGQTGLRPLQAAEFTLTSFNIPIFPSRMGGGQLEAFANCLKRPYGENLFWFEPVPPARLIVALLETADVVTKHRELLQEAARQVYHSFGLLPQLQQTTQIPALNALERIISKVLFGNAHIKDVWHVVEPHGGYV